MVLLKKGENFFSPFFIYRITDAWHQFDRTMILSAILSVESLWAMSMTVLPRQICLRFLWMIASDSESKEDVASSKINILGAVRSTRAMAIRQK